MKISVVTTLHNAVDTIGDCMDSMASQSYADREHLVMDGGSADGTLEILQRRRDQLAVLVSERDGGTYDGLNKGIAHATGDVLGILHGDDVYADGEVLAQVARAFADPAVDAVYGDLVYVAAEDTTRVIRYWRAGEYRPQRLRWGWMPPHPTLFLRRSLYERFGVFDTRYSIAADYDLMLRMLTQLQGRVLYLPEVLVRMRLGGVSNRSLRNLLRKSWEDYQALHSNQVGGLGALAWKNVSKLPQFFVRGACA
ncbi:glycosyltransferase family 2 protein [Halochromatium salexigens]|uniref:Glycosyl transferase n=1 Tax=Halochromatium salexigens TaxID=49447 RepID=A0AAJ0XEP2_HALSE|nr:glycosyltransferase family 2 protein [Halochromatium salexigens]MBK5930059.1 glycosyl transferase [Halochromatium salexigens]